MKKSIFGTICVFALSLVFVISANCPSFAGKTGKQTVSKPAAKTALKSTKAKKKIKKVRIKTDANVKKAQLALIKAGYKIKADGILGRYTTGALKKYQKKMGLKISGRLDKNTKIKMGF